MVISRPAASRRGPAEGRYGADAGLARPRRRGMMGIMRLTWDRTARSGQAPATEANSPAQPAGGPPAAGPLPAPAMAGISDDLAEDMISSLLRRRLIIRGLVTVSLAIPLVTLITKQGFAGRVLFLVPANVALIGLLYPLFSVNGAGLPRRRQWWWWWHPAVLTMIVALGIGTFAVGGMSWLTALAIAAAALGSFARTLRAATIGIMFCAAVGLGVTVALYPGYGNVFSATIIPPLAGFLAHSAERRNQLITRLRETRAELARMAVAEERLRIARDLHDLLGHSLSLIALKAELAGRLVAADPARAAAEIAAVETVARRSLTEVRQAVTSYRQPSLAAELAAARRMLAAAGIDCRLEVPAAYSLPPAADTLLAWTVREGATNIVRHSGARHAHIRVDLDGSEVRAELTDDGAGPAPGRDGRPDAAGSGLAGLAERAARLGGTLLASASGEGGFLLRVRVPLAGGDGAEPDGAEPASTEPASTARA